MPSSSVVTVSTPFSTIFVVTYFFPLIILVDLEVDFTTPGLPEPENDANDAKLENKKKIQLNSKYES
jgi:hypothetical protein